MDRRKLKILMRLVLMAAVLLLTKGSGTRAQNGNGQNNGKAIGKMRQTTQAQRQQAAKNRKAQINAALAAGATLATYDSSKGPDYFGTTPNYATSPLPTGGIGRIVPIFGGSAFTAPVVDISDAYNPLAGGATATAALGVGGSITGFTVTASAL